MNRVHDALHEHMTARAAESGERTGPLSKILSHVGLLIIVFLMAHLVHQKAWIALGILIISAIPSSVSIGVLLYFVAFAYLIYLGETLGAVLVASAQVTNIGSRSLGLKNARREIIRCTTGVSPFEGMSSGLPIIIQSISIFVAFLTGGLVSQIAWFVFGLSILYSAVRYLCRLYPTWARLHYPLMIRWARFAAEGAVRESRSGHRIDIEPELCAFVESVGGDSDRAQEIVNESEYARAEFKDREAIRQFLEGSSSKKNLNKINELLDQIQKLLDNDDDRGLRVRYAIASLIENDFGTEERIRYLCAVYSGKAN